jgi:hypothetical protein
MSTHRIAALLVENGDRLDGRTVTSAHYAGPVDGTGWMTFCHAAGPDVTIGALTRVIVTR